jgi:predicted RNA-binding Zn ribbon-like protein
MLRTEMDEPAQRMPAPEGLELVQAFVNSADIEAGTDDLRETEAAAAWLRDRAHVPVGALGDADRLRLVGAREALRTLLGTHSGETADPGVAARLQDLLAGAVLRPVVDARGARLVAAGEGVDAFLGIIGARIAEATVAGTWERLKVCHDDVCRWAFFDYSKNARGTWCSMRVCGNRAKARAYRERQRAATSA